jgi:hypothetical protein
MSTCSSSLAAFLAWTPFDALHQCFSCLFCLIKLNIIMLFCMFAQQRRIDKRIFSEVRIFYLTTVFHDLSGQLSYNLISSFYQGQLKFKYFSLNACKICFASLHDIDY